MNDHTLPATPARLRIRTLAAALATSMLMVLGLLAGSPASAAPLPAVTGPAGWMRVAHLSPDTKPVDVRLTALSGGDLVLALKDVKYGTVSQYAPIAAGTYVVSMVPAGSPASMRPMLSGSVKIVEGKTITVAAFGENVNLRTRVFQDDLTSPEAGDARIRLIQASTVTRKVDVQTTSGILIAADAASGEATSYANVPAGPWNLKISAPGIVDSAAVDLPNGTVNTLFVLDNADGGLTVMPVLDSASVGETPVGALETGGGGLALDLHRGFAQHRAQR